VTTASRSWEVERHPWARIGASLEVVPELLDAFARSSSAPEAQTIRAKLERVLVPNGVVQRGAPEAAMCLIQTFWTSPRAAQICCLELVSYFAAGSVAPTSADPRVLMRMADALRPMLPVAAELVQRSDIPEERYLAVDILDSMYWLYPSEQGRIAYVLRKFAATGPNEERRMREFLREIEAEV